MNERFTLVKKLDMETNVDNTTEPQHDAKLPVISSALVGKKLPTKDGGWLKIMAFCDNYYMARFKRCIPFCCNEKELKERIEAHCL